MEERLLDSMELVYLSTPDGYTSEGLLWPSLSQPAKLGAVLVHGWTYWHDPRVLYRGFCGQSMAAIGSRLAEAGVPTVLTMNRGFHAPEFFNDCTIDFHTALAHEEGKTIAPHEAQTLVRNVDHGYRGTTLDAASKISVSLYSFAAEREWAWFQEVTKGLRDISSKTTNIEAEIIQGVRDHAYSGYEEVVAERVIGWLQRTLQG